MPEQILTSQQAEQLRQFAADTGKWRNESDLSRRRRVGLELQQLIERLGVSQGNAIDHRQFCELVSLQWQIQNLNPMQMPKLLGLYHYKVHFSGYQGTQEDLLAQRKQETGKEGFYPGADLAVVSESLHLIASGVAQDQIRGASMMLDLPGAGQALVSGFLYLLHPASYGMVNSPTKAPFENKGWLRVTEQQRRAAREKAEAAFSGRKSSSNKILQKVWRWQVFLAEVLQICNFQDYHEQDQFLLSIATGVDPDADARIRSAVQEIRSENAATRKTAEVKASQLIADNLGQLTAEQFTELFTLINTCEGAKGVNYTRFAPAFVGHNANQLIDQKDELNQWIVQLWRASEEEVPGVLNRFWEEKVSGGGRSFPTMILYLRDREKYAIWTANLEKALYSVMPGMPARIRTGFSYLQYCKGVQVLRAKEPFPPEMHDFVLFKLIKHSPPSPPPAKGDFAGFTEDAFRFMQELVQNNNEDWFAANRQRFKSNVDRPLRALVKDLGKEVIAPMDPGLETTANSNNCLSRIRKNLYGRTTENCYQELYWAAFYRKGLSKQTDCQLFVSVRPSWLQHGIYFGEQADPVRERLAQALLRLPQIGKAIFERLREADYLFAAGEDQDIPEPIDISNYDSFVELARDHRFNVYRRATPKEAVDEGPALKDKIGEDFRQLYPLFLLATSEQPEIDVPKILEVPLPDEDQKSLADLAAETFLEEDFFETLGWYLSDKRQLIFVGPPGTGKTYVAEQYAEYLAQGGGEVQIVQFHPSYSYEDFIEGLRPVPSENGSLSYKVQPGLFKRFCDQARANPKGKYVLLVDEINRGNIPRIFGELLFLLERRGKPIDLPYSNTRFSIPPNVIVLGTMNSSDRSIALMDLALRRRFHFVDMQPRGDVLLAWLRANDKPAYVRDIFERLNESLRKAGIDADRLLGHAHFMTQQLDDDYLELIWEGTILPMLKEYFFAEPKRLDEFRFEKFLGVIEQAEAAAEEEAEEDEGGVQQEVLAAGMPS